MTPITNTVTVTDGIFSRPMMLALLLLLTISEPSHGAGADTTTASWRHGKGRGVWGAASDAPCTQLAPCIHLVPHTHLDPGWRRTFDAYLADPGRAIHRAVVTALAKDPRRRFTFADTAFLVRWLEESGGEHTPGDCTYVSHAPPSSDDATVEPCPMTWLSLIRRLLRDGRVDVVGGGWVSHDESLTRTDAAAAQFEVGVVE